MDAEPTDEARRLEALHRYDILDTPSEPAFDDIVRLAARICGMPIALVSLVDEHRQWFKARVGLDIAETARNIAFCDHAIRSDGLFEVPDARVDARFATNPLVAEAPGIRFYAGVPLETSDGHSLGTLCVLDRTPRTLSDEQKADLAALARLVIDQLELRRTLATQRLADERHRLIVESATDYAIISMDLAGRVTSWNSGACAIFGWTEAEMLGDRCDAFFTSEDRAAGVPEAEMRNALTHDRGNDMRWHLRRDGSRFWASGEMMPLRDGHGEAVGFIKILRDETAARLASMRLVESEARYRSLHDALDAGFCIVEVAEGDDGALLDYRFVEVNAAFGRQTGMSDPVGRWMAEMRPAHEDHWFEIYARVAVTGEPVRFEQQAAALGNRWFDVFAYRVGEPSLRQVAILFTDITERRRDEARLRALNENLEALVAERTAELGRVLANSQDAMLVLGLDGIVQSANQAVASALGWTRDEMVGRHVFDFIHPDDQPALAADGHLRADRYREERAFKNRVRLRQGGERWFSWIVKLDGGLLYTYGRDITAEVEQAAALVASAEQLRQSQKMEAVGQLTGGLAHDFNNLLTGISGSLELLELRVRQGRVADIDRYVAAAKGATRRAAALTHRLLAFSRQQTLDPRTTDANRLIADMEELVRRSVGPSIDIAIAGAPDLWSTRVDPNQLENALLNLCINARDAMPDGGRIVIATTNERLDAPDVDDREAMPGEYVCIAVTDSGCGMSPDVVERAFDPFFTTKPIGRGTGLGLSMIYGFCRQSGGLVRIDSTPGRGTTMRLYLPRDVEGSPDEPGVRPAEPGDRHGRGETVLIIDDEPSIRMLIAEVLGEWSYRSLEAADGAEGLEILRSPARIDLLITDVGLPGGMNGRQVADAARALRPGLRVLFVTGFAENTDIGQGPLDPGTQILTKPFALDELASKVRGILAP